MRVATWNVNSLKARQERVEAWINDNEPDVVLLQETKCSDAAFPTANFSSLGYQSVHHGSGRWNGVAILSKVGLERPQAGFSDEARSVEIESRVISATCGGIRVYSVYVPNGRVVDSEFYLAKLEWLAHLGREVKSLYQPESNLLIGGDFNVAPQDRDVWDITKFAGMTHVTERERAAVAALVDWGLVDAVRQIHPDSDGPFSWWDYRAGAFHKGWGMRIDLLLVTAPIAAGLRSAVVDREARKKGPQATTSPSDHAPLLIEFDLST